MKNQKKPVSAFTLIEMVIVLVIIGIMLMATLYLSWDQIQKVRDKTVKESILAEMQSRYSRNLWSSSYAWIMYKYMDVSLISWNNRISFDYIPKNNSDWENRTFTNKFTIERIITNSDGISKHGFAESITLRYFPYQISCERWLKENNWDINTWDMKNTLILVTRVNDSRNYCFEINNKNCRLMEMSESKCETLQNLNPNQ